MNERICLNCSHYRYGFCQKIKFHQTVVDPKHTCGDIDVNMGTAIKNRLCLRPKWQAWAIPRFAICVLVAVAVSILIIAAALAFIGIGDIFSANVIRAIIMLFIACILCFFIWCCISLIVFILEDVLE